MARGKRQQPRKTAASRRPKSTEREAKHEPSDSEEEESGPPPAKRSRKGEPDRSAPPPQSVITFQTSSRPPPTISLANAEEVHLSEADKEEWCSEDGGKRAASRGHEYDKCRLLGSADLVLRLPAQAVGLVHRPAPAQDY